MTLPQLRNLRIMDRDVTDDSHGKRYDRRSVEELLNYGIILLDKPPGPTSHEVVAWAKRILNVPKIGHSGTLDPQVTGVLPLGLGEATKALGVLLLGPKEYLALGRLHAPPPAERLDEVLAEFTGKIYQKPPQRSSVLRRTRTREIYGITVLERKGGLLLARILCEAGTYIRKLFYDIGEVLGPGASMVELRRTRVDHFTEGSLVTLHQVADAYSLWKEGDDSALRGMILPVEHALQGVKSVVIRDSAVDALCHGAQLAIPGILEVTPGLGRGDAVAVYTQKGEAVALAESLLDEREIEEQAKGYALRTRRIIMAPGTYPRNWRSTKRPAERDGPA